MQTLIVEDLAIEGHCGDACALREIPVVTMTMEMDPLLRVFKKNGVHFFTREFKRAGGSAKYTKSEMLKQATGKAKRGIPFHWPVGQ
jgi:hypothetical protein